MGTHRLRHFGNPVLTVSNPLGWDGDTVENATIAGLVVRF